MLAENLYSQVDADGFQYSLLNTILAHRKDQRAVTKENKSFVHKNGRRSLKRTTIGWEMKVLWKDGTEEWIPLKDLKEANPIEVAEYAVANAINDEPAFCWWTRNGMLSSQ